MDSLAALDSCSCLNKLKNKGHREPIRFKDFSVDTLGGYISTLCDSVAGMVFLCSKPRESLLYKKPRTVNILNTYSFLFCFVWLREEGVVAKLRCSISHQSKYSQSSKYGENIRLFVDIKSYFQQHLEATTRKANRPKTRYVQIIISSFGIIWSPYMVHALATRKQRPSERSDREKTAQS